MSNIHTHPLSAGNSLVLAAFDELLGLQKKAEEVMERAKDKEDGSMTLEEREILKHYEEGLQKALDLIAPAAMEIKHNEIILNDLHSRTLYVYNWPNYIYPNWLSQAVNFEARWI